MRGQGDGLVNKEFAENENSDPQNPLKNQAGTVAACNDRQPLEAETRNPKDKLVSQTSQMGKLWFH